jgi:hypothetical protein
MQPQPGLEVSLGDDGGAARRSLGTRALMILWPSFLMAGVLEMMVFAVVDPSSLHWFGADPIDWSRSAVYSVTFLIFWGAMSMAGAITALLEQPGPGTSRWP